MDRYMKRIKDNVVLTYDSNLIATRGTEFVEIPKQVAEYMLDPTGDTPKPPGISSMNAIPADIVEVLTKLGKDKLGLVQDYLNKLEQSEVLGVEAIAKPNEVISPELIPEDVEDDFIPLKDDPENRVDGLDKPLAKMNRGELNMHAELFCPGLVLEERDTNAIRLSKIKTWEANRKK